MNQDPGSLPVVDDGDLLVLPADEETGLALVLGRGDVAKDLGAQLDSVPEQVMGRITQHLGLAGRFAGAFDPNHGRWVRLTAESAEKFRALGPAKDASGTMMGVLRGDGGQFAHVARFDFAAPVPVDPGTLVAALAVQQVVRQIEIKLDAIARGVDALVQGSKNELEAKLASAFDIIQRIERRMRDRGRVDADDWASLANLEPIVKEAYHQTFLWLDPLRRFLADDDLSMVQQVRSLRDDHGLKDVDFWLRMHVHSELALKRWEVLYLIRESDVAPERLATEANEIRRRAEERHSDLLELLDDLDTFLDSEEEGGFLDRFRFINRNRLQRLRAELVVVANAYADALAKASREVPEYVPRDPSEMHGPLIDLDAVRETMKAKAMPALSDGVQSARRFMGRIGTLSGQALQNARKKFDEEESEGRSDAGPE